ncbi:MAG: UDP-N-acetylmuramoyl-tripeptide--D-alanyl-D-alanine ligase [Deltaproteobacteria bacterium]|nr:UDP-N-acetylmuramoyl-tripeptide--D-alanyl-D-alanine ligase [Deltaproteobacteria bacterium]
MAELTYPSLTELRLLLGAAGGAGGSAVASSICTDTRRLRPGALFVALPGPAHDGHDFVGTALQGGALAAVVDRAWQAGNLAESRLLRVDSPLQAYQAIARWQRQQFAGPVIGVTGSVGKTTTKELIAAALASLGPVLATAGNLNHETGVPITLLQLAPHHRAAVIEMGMRGPGQILELAAVALPEVAVITNVGTAHIGLLGSRLAIARAKCELLESLGPGAVAVLNADCPLLLETARSVWQGPKITFGLTGGDLHGRLVDERILEVDGRRLRVPLAGAHHGCNFLAALAVARHLGVSWDQLGDLTVTLPSGRGGRVERPDGVVLLDESYNAAPESTRAALELLGREPVQRRIAVLGTMLELGDHSLALHHAVGEAVAKLGVDLLLVLAPPAEAAALTGGATGVPCRCHASRDELVEDLRTTLRPGDGVLFKASRAVGFDQVIAALCAVPPG